LIQGLVSFIAVALTPPEVSKGLSQREREQYTTVAEFQ